MSMNKSNDLKYFLYARKSSESEDKQVASIASQIDELKELAKRNGLKIKDVLTEEKSAKAPGRTVFTNMIERIHAGEAQGIICWKLDRLARNPVDGGTISWSLQQGVIQHIQTFQRSYLPTDNVLMMSVEFGSANQFILDLSHNVKRGLRHKIADGWFPSKTPLGYLNNTYKDPTKPPVYKDPERFDLIRKLWEILLEKKYSILKMSEIAHEIGLRTRKQSKIVKSEIHYILTNPFYYGSFIWKKELCPGVHEPMITKSEFDAAQKIIRTSLRKDRYGCKEFAFTGLMKCGECGAGITAEDKTKHCQNGNVHHYTYYRCNKSVNPKCSQKTIRDTVLDEQIKDVLGRITIPAEFHDWAMKCLKEDHEKEKQDQQTIRDARNNAVKLCDRKISSLIDLRLAEEIEPEVFKRRKEELLAEKKRLEELVQDAGYRVERWLNYADQALEFAESAKLKFETGDRDTKRGILAALGTVLILKNRTLSVSLKRPLELIERVAPDVQPFPTTLEPAEAFTTQGEEDYSYPPNENWLGD
jgi:site-specific DNA recombinase